MSGKLFGQLHDKWTQFATTVGAVVVLYALIFNSEEK